MNGANIGRPAARARRRGRFIRCLFWSAVGASAASLALWVMTIFAPGWVGLWWGWTLGVQYGRVNLWHYTLHAPPKERPRLEETLRDLTSHPWEFNAQRCDLRDLTSYGLTWPSMTFEPDCFEPRASSRRAVAPNQVRVSALGISLPCWSLLLMSLAAAALLARLGGIGRKRGPHDCGCCGYDLTGNMSGRCPECGAACGMKLDATA